MAEQNTDQAIRARQITDVHANRSSQSANEAGKFSHQLILDNGTEEAPITLSALEGYDRAVARRLPLRSIGRLLRRTSENSSSTHFGASGKKRGRSSYAPTPH